ncbi:hypothetical protein [Sphingobium sp. HDIP04]|uniref:hypothetical protein n=1 Tax=Sphingobium sp. HDIP04 TaxID=428994 RepID=UPI0003879A8B|nr:hypothetical protein [Sphingobium sp. HDIP04]EQA97250.1 hypothetical protein L286_23275 [Sphingobium sp. HDIP04]
MGEHRFVIVTRSGRAENCKDGSTYWSILSDVYARYQSAGGNWDRPNMLLLNGKIVIASGLADKAWDYGRAKFERTAQTVAALQVEQAPDFLKDLKP